MRYPNHSGVYQILHVQSKRVYIGCTKCFRKRVNEHLFDLRHNQHHCKYLQRAWNKYGEEAFQFSVLEACSPEAEILLSREAFWMCEYGPLLFNSKKEGTPWGRGEMSPESKKSVSERMMGNKLRLGKHDSSKLDEEAVRDIFARFARGESRSDIAALHNVASESLYAIIRRKTWWNVEIPSEILEGVRQRLSIPQGPRKLTADQVAIIKAMINKGDGDTKIAKEFGVTHANIRCIRNGASYKYIEPHPTT